MAATTPTDYYEALGVEPTASALEIETAYWQHSKSGGDRALLNEARSTLLDAGRRAAYDAQREARLRQREERLAAADQGPSVSERLNRWGY